LAFNITGLFRPTPRGPITNKETDAVIMKSAALACENFVLSIMSIGNLSMYSAQSTEVLLANNGIIT
jgi:hypothetical protein